MLNSEFIKYWNNEVSKIKNTLGDTLAIHILKEDLFRLVDFINRQQAVISALESKAGIYYCAKCGSHFACDYDYCPYCGADRKTSTDKSLTKVEHNSLCETETYERSGI